MTIATISNFKGGAFKTTFTFHLAELASEFGKTVLAVDADSQGDLYRRFGRTLEKSPDRPPMEWAPGCWCIYSPTAWESPTTTFDIILVDTPPSKAQPTGPRPDATIIPVSGIDAGLNANETLIHAVELGVPRIVLVKSCVEEGGKVSQREFDDLAHAGIPNVELCPVSVSRGGSIVRHDRTCRPAWAEPFRSTAAREMREACQWILTRLGVIPPPAPPASSSPRTPKRGRR